MSAIVSSSLSFISSVQNEENVWMPSSFTAPSIEEDVRREERLGIFFPSVCSALVRSLGVPLDVSPRLGSMCYEY